MNERKKDGSAGDADYGKIGTHYSSFRQPEPTIAAQIVRALCPSQTILNLGAGAGSYEPADREVTAVEPSAAMRAQRPPHLAVALAAVAENLPFADAAFDASMATFTVHQWSNLEAGLAEMRRVTSGPVIILTCDPLLVETFWLNDYAPGVLSTEARRYPALDRIGATLGGRIKIEPVPILLECRDGFNEAHYGRPERLLEAKARLACSAWGFVDELTSRNYVDHLRRDLEDGSWDARYGRLRHQPIYDGSLRLIIAEP